MTVMDVEVLEGADSSKETEHVTLWKEPDYVETKLKIRRSDLEKFIEVGEIYNSNCH